jgi:UTRA domain
LPKTVEGEEFLTTTEAMAELGASRKRFYDNARPLLQVYRFDAKKTPWYSKKDVLALKVGKPRRKASIVISGMYGSWSSFAESQYEAETDLLGVKETTLPDEIAERFQISVDRHFAKRSQATRVDGEVICTWDTYYPMSLVASIMEPLKHGEIEHVTEYVQTEHGLTAGFVRDIYSSRMNSFDELNLFQLRSDVPMLILQRAAYTRDKGTLMWVSDMVLKGDVFAHEHKYETPVK